jgi:hypothetical protein
MKDLNRRVLPPTSTKKNSERTPRCAEFNTIACLSYDDESLFHPKAPAARHKSVRAGNENQKNRAP